MGGWVQGGGGPGGGRVQPPPPPPSGAEFLEALRAPKKTQHEGPEENLAKSFNAGGWGGVGGDLPPPPPPQWCRVVVGALHAGACAHQTSAHAEPPPCQTSRPGLAPNPAATSADGVTGGFNADGGAQDKKNTRDDEKLHIRQTSAQANPTFCRALTSSLPTTQLQSVTERTVMQHTHRQTRMFTSHTHMRSEDKAHTRPVTRSPFAHQIH